MFFLLREGILNENFTFAGCTTGNTCRAPQKPNGRRAIYILPNCRVNPTWNFVHCEMNDSLN